MHHIRLHTCSDVELRMQGLGDRLLLADHRLAYIIGVGGIDDDVVVVGDLLSRSGLPLLRDVPSGEVAGCSVEVGEHHAGLSSPQEDAVHREGECYDVGLTRAGHDVGDLEELTILGIVECAIVRSEEAVVDGEVATPWAWATVGLRRSYMPIVSVAVGRQRTDPE